MSKPAGRKPRPSATASPRRLRLAERMGGMAATVPAASEAEGVIQFARANNITHIVTTASRGLALARDSSRHRWRSRSCAGPAR